MLAKTVGIDSARWGFFGFEFVVVFLRPALAKPGEMPV
jgi:hypothetical protein